MFNFLRNLFRSPRVPPAVEQLKLRNGLGINYNPAVTTITSVGEDVINYTGKAPKFVTPKPIFFTEPTGLTFVKEIEGCRLEAYQDIVGVWTIGYGHTGPEVKEGLVWTQEQADTNVKTRYQIFQDQVTQLCAKLELNVNQISALTSFAYNLGAGCIRSLIKDRTIPQISEAILLYNKAGGKPVRGLMIRRMVERDIFNHDVFADPLDVRAKLTQYRNEVK